MKRVFAVCLVAWLGAVGVRAGPAETAIVAAMRLSEKSNYSWVTTVSDDARTYDIDGKTVRGGFTWVKMPAINSVRRRLGRSVTDTRIDMIFQGNVACVIQTDEGWMRPEELPPPEDPDSDLLLLPATGHAPLGGGMPGVITKSTVIRRGKRSDPRDDEERNYSNLQLAINHPHEELGVIVSSHQEFKVEGDVVTGTLTDLGAQLLLVHDGQKEISPRRAAGTFKLWLRDGIVAKYQVRLEGVLVIDTPRGRRQVDVHQTSDTLVKDVGTTTFDVPAQARSKLQR
jgi:hypothetical protein